jgi:hypothetical protein
MDLNNAAGPNVLVLAYLIDTEVIQPFLDAVTGVDFDPHAAHMAFRSEAPVTMGSDETTPIWRIPLTDGVFAPEVADLEPKEALQIWEVDRGWSYSMVGGQPGGFVTLARFGRHRETGKPFAGAYNPALDGERMYAHFADTFAAFRQQHNL